MKAVGTLPKTKATVWEGEGILPYRVSQVSKVFEIKFLLKFSYLISSPPFSALYVLYNEPGTARSNSDLVKTVTFRTFQILNRQIKINKLCLLACANNGSRLFE